MKTLQLEMDYDFGFALFGVVSPCRDYKMAWSLNRLLGLNLIRQNELCYEMPDRQKLLIANFEHNDGHSTVRLFRNKALGSSTLKRPFLLPDIKEYDYVLQITGALQQYLNPQDLMGRLQRLTLIQYAKQFDPLTLKHKEHLLF
ncbi:IPExxxVDY family protein [Pontibacter sp. JH31]|uniref:IPExxxVDY family protein n=1 Tax=Pontibacter aquaedesilientis TaxID=2766980 RepID=A0ABR7XI52_9BACT|nr:IPExxxVDY family protein [Pontibacter aquaedesilientis]MBD1397928.1 IPExxxVDY family protein [Pontibacter aquaedesilientis]